MNSLDLTFVFAYLTATVVTGILVGVKQTGASFWVHRRSTSAVLVAISVISTQVGAGAVIGIASATYEGGIGLLVVSITSTTVGFLALGYLAPLIKRFGDRYNAVSLGEFLAFRYGRRTQVASAAVVTIAYSAFLAAQFVTLAALLNVWSGIAFHIALAYACVGLIAYTAFAGLRGDMITDVLHFCMMVCL